MLRAVLFAPEDLALVRGDPSERRRYLDDLATLGGIPAHQGQVLGGEQHPRGARRAAHG
ncbi:hypothetical protein MAHJHV28_46130 [Mycobacterium avium subsp. hominissuis]